MKALIVGFGKMGLLHAAILNALPAVGSIAVCESSATVRRAVGAFKPPFRMYTDHRAALKESDFDLAVVATPNRSHLEIFKDLAGRGIHTFVEKPFVLDRAEAEEARRFTEQLPRPPKLMVGYCLRFMPTYRLAKTLLADGVLGAVKRFEAKMYSSDVRSAHKGWRFERGSGGVLSDLGCHLADLVRHFFGMPSEVSGLSERQHSKYVQDRCRAELTYGSYSGSFDVCWSMPDVRKPQAEIAVVGENGTLSVNSDTVEFTLSSKRGAYDSGTHRKDMVDLWEPVPFDLAGPFYTKQLMEFVAAVKSGAPHINGLDESVLDHELLGMLGRSSEKAHG